MIDEKIKEVFKKLSENESECSKIIDICKGNIVTGGGILWLNYDENGIQKQFEFIEMKDPRYELFSGDNTDQYSSATDFLIFISFDVSNKIKGKLFTFKYDQDCQSIFNSLRFE